MGAAMLRGVGGGGEWGGWWIKGPGVLQSSFSRVEANPLPPGTAAQKAELTALIHALELGKDLRANTYTNSKYDFLALHTHTAIRKEGGLLTA